MTKAERIQSLPPAEVVPLSPDGVQLPFEPGDLISGKYEVIGLIGTGGMGFVISAMHVELRELVALKFLRPEALANPEIVARFATEARACVRIKSEHVARVFDVGTLPSGEPFIVMEHLEGSDLCDLTREEGPLSVKVAIDYVIQVCEALAAAHSVGIVHRDIKPENLFLAERAHGMPLVKVLDFGISKVALTGSAFDTGLPLVRTMMPMGSPVYMSPEQIRGSEDVDGRTDIWSLGCVLYELLTGVAAFDAPSLTQLSATILEKDPVPLRDLAPEVPAELEAVILRCLEKKADTRFQSIAELALALYPFGPRRARVSAERCAFLLQGPSSAAAFELPSIHPPAHSTGPAVTPSRISAAPSRTTSPAAFSVREARPVSQPPSTRSSKGAWVVGLSVLVAVLAAGGYARMRATPDMGGSPPRAASRGGEPAMTARIPSPTSVPGPVPEVAAAASIASPLLEAPVKPRSRGAAHAPRPRRVVAVEPGERKPPRARTGDDADVGF